MTKAEITAFIVKYRGLFPRLKEYLLSVDTRIDSLETAIGTDQAALDEIIKIADFIEANGELYYTKSEVDQQIIDLGFTPEEKEKLSGIQTGAQKNLSASQMLSALEGLQAFSSKYATNEITEPIKKSANFSISAEQHKRDIIVEGSTATVIAIPSNDIDVGFSTDIWQIGTGEVSFSVATGVDLKLDDGEVAVISQRYNAVTLKKIAENIWVVIGGLKRIR